MSAAGALLGVALWGAILAATGTLVTAATAGDGGSSPGRRLPDGFLVGAGTSAYQIEGAWNTSGKGASTLDRAYGRRPDGGGNVACDSYHRFAEDVAMLKLLGASHYRFSMAWARLLPTGEADNVNQDAVRYYNALIDELQANGIEPIITLYHMDIPAALDDKFHGWLSPKMADYFEAYAVTAFKHFGNRVRRWVTLNEPYMFCVFGVGHGRLGASQVRPGDGEYLCGHHMLLAHAKAYRAYKQDFAHQGGEVGLSLQNFFTRPCSSAQDDVVAAEAHQQFELAWFLDPLLGHQGDGQDGARDQGQYPPLMRQRVDANSRREGRNASRLPAFTPEEQRLLAGALDFLGLNVYFGWSACHGVPAGARDPSIERDAEFIINGTTDQFLPPGPFRSTPWAMRATLNWLRQRYGYLQIIITENGFGDDGVEGLHDRSRVDYLQRHLSELLAAIHEDKHDIRGYFAWALLDDFEWGAGFKSKFGLVHVDFDSGSLRRTPRDSLSFLRDFFRDGRLPSGAAPGSTGSASTVLLGVALVASLVPTLAAILVGV